MQTMHLFAGVGGGLLADLILGHEPIIAVERDAYCCKVLRERTADGWFPNLQVWEGDIRLFDPSEYKGRVDCVHAGFPCQPHSVAGKRKGEADERNLWPDTARIVGEIRPRFVFLENVPGIVSNGFAAVVVGELSAMGYDSQWGIISASNAGACHRRARWWCVSELSDATNGGRKQTQGEKNLFPTPTATDYKGAPGVSLKKRAEKSKRGVRLPEELARCGDTGRLNPTWVEWLMGWPLGWTNLKPSETVKSQSKRHSPGGFL